MVHFCLLSVMTEKSFQCYLMLRYTFKFLWFFSIRKLQNIKSGLKHYKWFNSVLQRWLLFPAGPVCGSPNVPPSRLVTVQDFLNKLGIKPCIHLVEISNFSLNHVTVRLTKIMNNLREHLKILIFKVIFKGWKLVES